jgi:hypothetical protein
LAATSTKFKEATHKNPEKNNAQRKEMEELFDG